MKELKASAETCTRAVQYIIEHVQGQRQSFSFAKENTQGRIAERLGMSQMHMSRVVKQLRSDGRLVQNPDRSWSAYADADPARVTQSQKKLKQRGSVFDLQQTVNQLQRTVDQLLERLEALAALPPAAAAAVPPSPLAADPLELVIRIKAADAAELERFRELQSRGGSASLSDQLLQLCRALFEAQISLPLMTEYYRSTARVAATVAAVQAQPPADMTVASAAGAAVMPAAVVGQTAGNSQAGSAPDTTGAVPEPAAEARSVQEASDAVAAAVARALAQADPDPAAGTAASGPASRSRVTAASGQAGGAPAAVPAPDLTGIPRPHGQLRALPSGASGVPAFWPREWPAGTYGCDEQGVIFYLRGREPLPLPRLVRPDPQLPARMLTEDGQILTAQRLLAILQEHARSPSPQWQEGLSRLQQRHD